jgi:hypothetical protein
VIIAGCLCGAAHARITRRSNRSPRSRALAPPACLADIEQYLARQATVTQRRTMTLSTTVSTRLMMMQLTIGKKKPLL